MASYIYLPGEITLAKNIANVMAETSSRPKHLSNWDFITVNAMLLSTLIGV